MKSLVFLLVLGTALIATAADLEKPAPPAALLPHMKDLPADYQDRLHKSLEVMDERLEKLQEGKEQPVIWTNTAICSFVLGRNLDRLNKYLESDAYNLKPSKKNVEKNGFRLFSTSFIRFYALYNSHTGVSKGRLAPGGEKKLEEYLWTNTATCVPIAEAKRDPWDSRGGENGMVTNSVGNLLAAQYLRALPEYANQKFKDGSTAAEQYDAWRAYVSAYLDEHVKRGQFQEYGASYQEYTLSALINLFDFAEDPMLRKKAEMFLDLAFASMAEETVNTQRGGPKARAKGHDRTCKLYKILFNAPGGSLSDTEYMNNYTLATSGYYPAKVVVDMANDQRGRGDYTFARLAPTRVIAGTYELRLQQQGQLDDEERSLWRKLDKDHPFLLEGFATPSYVLGSHAVDTTIPEEKLRNQRWEGLVFANNPMARIYIDGRSDELDEKYISNPLKSIQDRNVMVTMKWGTNIDKGVDPHLQVKFLNSLDSVEEDDGWIFAKSGDAFAAVKIVEGGYKWSAPWAHGDTFKPKEIRYVSVNSEASPIIFVSNDAADYHNDFSAFKTAVKAEPISYQDGILKFATIVHEGLSKPGTIGGKPVDSNPPFVFESPFIRSQRGSGVVYLRKGDEAMVLDFSDPNKPTKTVGLKPDEKFPAGVGNEKPIVFGK